MSVVLSETRLALLHLEISRQVRPHKDHKHRPLFGEVNLREYSYVLDELRRRRGEIGRCMHAPLTKWMIASQVGDTTVIPPKTNGAITTCRRSARRGLNNPDARWHAQTLRDGNIEIMRMDDGSDHIFGLPRSPIPGRLASMNPHGRLVIDYQGRRLPSTFKVSARDILGDSKANWRYTTLVNGSVLVVRTR